MTMQLMFDDRPAVLAEEVQGTPLVQHDPALRKRYLQATNDFRAEYQDTDLANSILEELRHADLTLNVLRYDRGQRFLLDCTGAYRDVFFEEPSPSFDEIFPNMATIIASLTNAGYLPTQAQAVVIWRKMVPASSQQYTMETAIKNYEWLKNQTRFLNWWLLLELHYHIWTTFRHGTDYFEKERRYSEQQLYDDLLSFHRFISTKLLNENFDRAYEAQHCLSA